MKLKSVGNIGIIHGLRKAFDDYGPEILSLVSLLAIGGASVAAFKASEEIVEIKEEFEEKEKQAAREGREESKSEKLNRKITKGVRYVWAYRYVIILDGVAIVCEVGANKINGSKIAGLSVALAASEDKIKKGIAKFKEKYGEQEFLNFRDDLRNDIVKEKLDDDDCPFGEDEILELDGKTPVFFDTYLHSLIQIPVEQVEEAIEKGKTYASRNPELCFNKWRGFLGLEDCPAGMEVEWNRSDPFKVRIGEMAFGSGKIRTIEYVNMPVVHRR